MSDTNVKGPRRRETRLGSVVLSYDFYIGVPAGLVAAVAVGLSDNVQNAAGLLIGTATVSAAIAALVLTGLTVLLTTISADYRAYLRQLPAGVAGLAGPYRLVVKVGSIGALASVVGGFAIGAPGGLMVGDFAAGAALAAAPGLALTAWATLGCIQVTEQFVEHWKNNDRAMDIEERRRAAHKRAG